jgi:hypothetical protein
MNFRSSEPQEKAKVSSKLGWNEENIESVKKIFG